MRNRSTRLTRLLFVFTLSCLLLCVFSLSPSFSLSPIHAQSMPRLATPQGQLSSNQYTVTRPIDLPSTFWGFRSDVSGNWAAVSVHTRANSNGSTGNVDIYEYSGSVWQLVQTIVPSNGTAKAFGYSLSMSGTRLIIGANTENNQGAAYVYVLNGATWEFQQRLTASDAQNGNRFGESVSIEGNYAVVGAMYASSNAGAAYMYTLSGGTWVADGKLTAFDGASGNNYGASVSIGTSGGIIRTVIGAFNKSPGAAYVYRRTGAATWTLDNKIVASDGTAIDNFGVDVALAGDLIAVGAPYINMGGSPYVGAVYIFARSTNTWTEQRKVQPADLPGESFFGTSVDLSGTTLIAGAWHNNSQDYAGQTRVFVQSGTTWPQQAKFEPTNHQSGDGIYRVSLDGDVAFISGTGANGASTDSGVGYFFTRSGTSWSETAKAFNAATYTGPDLMSDIRFGHGIDIDGDVALVGAPYHREKIGGGGAVYVFVRSGATWEATQKLHPNNPISFETFGTAISLDSARAAIGAPREQGGVYIFERAGGAQSAYIPAPTGNTEFGTAVALDGNTLVVGAPKAPASNMGTVYIYQFNGSSWALQQTLPTAILSEQFGYSLALHGDTLAIGAPYNITANGYAGAVYVYKRSGGIWGSPQTLVASNPGSHMMFGWDVDFDGQTLLVGMQNPNANGKTALAFTHNGTAWVESASFAAPTLVHSVEVARDYTILSGNQQAVVYRRQGASWTLQETLSPAVAEANDNYGLSLAFDGSTFFVGAPQRDANNLTDSGAVYAYKLPASLFTGNPTAGTTLEMSAISGQTDSATVNISNTGETDSALNVSLNTITSGYSVTGLPINSLAVGAAAQTITVQCDSAGTTPASGTLALTTNDPAQTAIQYPLTCDELLPAFTGNPVGGTTLEMSALSGQTDSTTVNISNTGEAGSFLNVSLNTITSGYSVTGLPINGLAVGGAVQTITVQCDSAGTTPASGTLALTTNDPAQTAINYPLTCVLLGDDGQIASTPTIDPSDSVTITLTDDDLAGDGSVSIIATSNHTTPENETLILSETAALGTFEGVFQTILATPAENNSQLEVVGGETLTFSYTDALDSTGAVNITRSSTTQVNTPEAPDVEELISNGGFEGMNKLSGWSILNPSDLTDVVRCNKPAKNKFFAHSGSCAFRFAGNPGQFNRIMQKVALAGISTQTGDTLTFSVWAKANAGVTGAKAVVIVQYLDTGLTQDKLNVPLTPTSGYTQVFGNAPIVLKGAVKSIKVQLKYAGIAGSLYLDDISLLLEHSVGALPLPASDMRGN